MVQPGELECEKGFLPRHENLAAIGKQSENTLCFIYDVHRAHTGILADSNSCALEAEIGLRSAKPGSGLRGVTGPHSLRQVALRQSA
jgi:hypothetical protein